MAFGNYNPYQMGGYQQPYYNDQLTTLRQQSSAAPLWVQGEAGAKAYPVAPGNSVILMDSESNTFYIKTADQSGMPMMRAFDYTERTAAHNPPVQAAQTPQGDFITRTEFNALKAKIDALTQPAAVTITKEEM